MNLSHKKRQIQKGIQIIKDALFELDGSDNWVNNEIWKAQQGINLIENPYQTIPADRYINITTSFCDPNGNSDKSHSHSINFNREISAALLYIELQSLVQAYNPQYKLKASIQDLEKWLITQKALLKIACEETGFIEDEGYTVGDYKTDYGSIDFFIEFGISYPEEIWTPTTE